MATTPQTVEQKPGGDKSLQEMAKSHLWMHFTRMSAYSDAEVPIIVRGDGCYVYDENGKRYLDGLSALFCVNAGHGRVEIGEAMAEQVKDLGFYTNWSYAHRARSSSPSGSPATRPMDGTASSSPPAAARRSSRR